MTETTSEVLESKKGPPKDVGAEPGHEHGEDVGHDDHAGHGHHPFLQHHFDTPQQQFDAGKMGIWLFLVTEVLFFSGLFCAYTIYRAQHPEIFVWAHYYLDTNLGALNTVVLLGSSLTAAWAVRCAQLEQKRGLIINIVITIACAFTFMCVKYVEYSHKFHDGLVWPGRAEKPLFGVRFNPKHEVWELESFKKKHPEAAEIAHKLREQSKQKEGATAAAGAAEAGAVAAAAGASSPPAAEGAPSAPGSAAAQGTAPTPEQAAAAPGVAAQQAGENAKAAAPNKAAAAKGGAVAVAPSDPGAEPAAPAGEPRKEPSAGIGQAQAGEPAQQTAQSPVGGAQPETPTKTGDIPMPAPVPGAPAAAPGISDTLAETNAAAPLPAKLGPDAWPLRQAGVLGPDGTLLEHPKNAHVFFSVYFFMTGLHGIHVIAGIIVWVWMLLRAMKGVFGENYFGPIDYSALYWHIVDLVWIYLFPLLYLIH
ncbi:MAG TPA: cytochrome c oxidase subunit 3 [Polyangiaceae bacterium]|nr:cytochrome c oxidase subunit 3 [Polyangiaceae bacterium]